MHNWKIQAIVVGMVTMMGGGVLAQETTAPAPEQSPQSQPLDVKPTSKIGRIQGRDLMGRTEDIGLATVPDTHLVRAGDTLWDLSQYYYRDAFLWPALWSYNPQVTNPHWIYPGDVIFLSAQAPVKELTKATEVLPAATPLQRRQSAYGKVAVPGLFLEELPAERGHVLFSEAEKHMLTLGDEVQIDWFDEDMRQHYGVGDRFSVFSEAAPVRDSDGEAIAHKLIRVGELEIVNHPERGLTTARITQAYREIERGDMILPGLTQNFELKNQQNAANAEGRIIDSFDTISQIGEQQFVVINRGAKDGVALGNRWIVFEQREGLGRLEEGEPGRSRYANPEDDPDNKSQAQRDEKDPRDSELEREDERPWPLGRPTRAPEFPKRDALGEPYSEREYTTADLPLRKIGEITVVGLQDTYCTAIVTDAIREFALDTGVVLVKGF